jgi:tripartite ATP-independent transporter DctP family solute receptor
MTLRTRLTAFAALAAVVWAGTAGAATLTIKLGHDQTERSTHQQAALKWKELVESRTRGDVKVTIFPAQLLGTGTQMVEQVQAGALEAALIPTAWIAPVAPSVQILDLPFLFPNRAVVYRVIDGNAGREILKPLHAKNMEGVAFWEGGFKQFTGHFPIREPKDYEGHKIRTMPAPVIVEQFKAFGATPVPIDFKELYSALQQKVVDGQENPIATTVLMRFYEVQKYLTLSDHGYIAYVFLMNKPMLDKLPAATRDILVQSAREAGQHQRQLIADSEKVHLDTMTRAGLEITRLTPEQRARFEQASRRVHDWYTQKYGAETLEMVRKEIQAAGASR